MAVEVIRMHLELTEQLAHLPAGEHLCLFYDRDPAEQMPALVPFIQDGLVHDEQFIYIADDQSVDALGSRLKEGGIDVASEAGRGRLSLFTRKEWRQPGELDSDKKAAQVRQFISDAAARGFKGVRFAVEMTWTLGPDIPADKLEHWEATINTLFNPSFPGRIVCQYNRSRLSPDLMLAALHTHPLLIMGEEVYPNLFYQAPLILNGNGENALHNDGNGQTSAVRLEWMLSQLRRARSAEKSRLEAEVLRRTNVHLRHFAAIVESSEDAIISKNLDGIIQSWNRGAQRIFGYTAEEVIGKPVTVLIPSGRKDEEAEILARIRRGERVEHYETIRQRKDGSLIDISLTVSPVRDDQGNVIGASKIARDITARRQAQEALRKIKEQLARTNDELEQRVSDRTASLREAIAQMEEFSYSVSHDLRSPVRAMQGYARIALEEFGESLEPRCRDYLERILRGSSRMERLIHDVLTYSRLARSEIEIKPVFLDRLLPELIQQYPEMQPPRSEVRIRPPLLPVLAHEPSLIQAISNLLSNSVKFVPPGTPARVQVWTERNNGNVRFWVDDNGIGIKPAHQARLFGMFERAHVDKQYDGTGIGLAIVRKALEKMGGTVGVHSDGITGSSFWFELPAADRQ